jgi:hypothetical protein
VELGVSEAERTDLGLSSDDSDGVHQDPTNAELEEYFRDDDDTRGASELSDVLDEVGHTIDCLLRLSITIRNPAPHDHFRSRTGAGLIDFYEPWDVKHAREKFPDAEQGIAERLGKATSRRRQYFKYREEHAKKLAEGLDEVPPEEPDRDKATTIASSIPRHLKDIETTDHLAEFDDTESNVSKTSYAPSNADAGLLRVPPLPKEYVDGPFQCPFCCMIVSIRTRRDWKKHVFRDLRPYVCLASSCGTPEQLYLRRGDWIDHMKQDHWKAWRCPFACSHLLHSKLDFLTHIKQSHPEGAFARNLDTLESLSSQPDLAKAKGTCPLCPFSIASHTQYASHVATHVEQLALFALPTSQGADHSDEDDSEASSAVFAPHPPGSDSSDGGDKHVDVEELVAGGDGVHASARDEMSASLVDDAPTLRSAASRDSQAPLPPQMAPVATHNNIPNDNPDGDSDHWSDYSSRHDALRPHHLSYRRSRSRAHNRTSSNGSSSELRERYELERVRAELEELRRQEAREDDESRTVGDMKYELERFRRQDEEEREYEERIKRELRLKQLEQEEEEEEEENHERIIRKLRLKQLEQDEEDEEDRIKRELELELEALRLQNARNDDESIKREVRLMRLEQDEEVDEEVDEEEEKKIMREYHEKLQAEKKKKAKDKRKAEKDRIQRRLELLERIEAEIRADEEKKQREKDAEEVVAKWKAKEAARIREERIKAEIKTDEEKKQREKAAAEVVAKWKAEEAARIKRERLEKEDTDKAYQKRLQEDLLRSGLTEKEVEAILKKEKLKREREEQEVMANRPVAPKPTYTRMSLRYLDVKTLLFYKIEWEYDQVCFPSLFPE